MLKDAGKDAILSKGRIARFANHDFIANQQVGIGALPTVFLIENLEHRSPRMGGLVPALDRSVTTAFACPAGDPQHRYATGHCQYSKDHPAHLP